MGDKKKRIDLGDLDESAAAELSEDDLRKVTGGALKKSGSLAWDNTKHTIESTETRLANDIKVSR